MGPLTRAELDAVVQGVAMQAPFSGLATIRGNAGGRVLVDGRRVELEIMHHGPDLCRWWLGVPA